MGAGALQAHEIALEVGEALLDLDELTVAEPGAAPGTQASLSLDVTGGRNMLVSLAGGRPVGTGALAGLEVYRVNASAAAARDAPDVGRYAGDLLEVLLREGEASLEAG